MIASPVTLDMYLRVVYVVDGTVAIASYDERAVIDIPHQIDLRPAVARARCLQTRATRLPRECLEPAAEGQ